MDELIRVGYYILPLLSLILVGYFSVVFGYFDKKHAQILMSFFMLFPLPIMNFGLLARIDLNTLYHALPFAVAFFILIFFIFIPVYFLMKYLSKSHVDATLYAMVASFPNIGFVGLPLILSLPDGHQYLHYWLVMVLVALMILALIFEPMLSTTSVESGFSLKVIVKSVLDSFHIPLVLASILGLMFAVFGITLPDAVWHMTHIVSESLVGTGLVSVGLGVSFAFMLSKDIETWSLIFVKAVVAPIVGYVIAELMGLGIKGTYIFVVLAACPSSGVAVVMSYKNSNIGDKMNQVMVGTVLLCFITCALVTSWLG